MFFTGSRYEPISEAEMEVSGGRTIRYKRMRFIPEIGGTLTVRVREGERPDLLAHRILGDPEWFWRLCDANKVCRPADLAAPAGRLVVVPGPGGT